MAETDAELVARFQAAYAGAVKAMGKHLVCLVASYVQLDNKGQRVGDEKIATFSGFVMSFIDTWFFVTAGHALQEAIDDKLKTGLVKRHHVGFHDSIGAEAKSQIPTLIDYESTPRGYVDDPTLGLDIGMID